MKLAFRASWLCRKTLTAEIQTGAPNASRLDRSPLPDNVREPQPVCKTEIFCPVAQLNMAKCAALSPFDCWRVFRKKRTRKCTIMVEAGTLPLDAIGRPRPAIYAELHEPKSGLVPFFQ